MIETSTITLVMGIPVDNIEKNFKLTFCLHISSNVKCDLFDTVHFRWLLSCTLV